MAATVDKGSSGQRSRELVDELATVLAQASPAQVEPLFVENMIQSTKSLHVAVIWDRWDNLPTAERSKVIQAAYTKAKRLPHATITAAMGLTGEEALWAGFLPYSIVTTRRSGDGASPEQLSKAMAGAGGIQVKVGVSTQLRFATQESAEEAYRRLSQAVPGPYWAIVYNQPAGE